MLAPSELSEQVEQEAPATPFLKAFKLYAESLSEEMRKTLFKKGLTTGTLQHGSINPRLLAPFIRSQYKAFVQTLPETDQAALNDSSRFEGLFGHLALYILNTKILDAYNLGALTYTTPSIQPKEGSPAKTQAGTKENRLERDRRAEFASIEEELRAIFPYPLGQNRGVKILGDAEKDATLISRLCDFIGLDEIDPTGHKSNYLLGLVGMHYGNRENIAAACSAGVELRTALFQCRVRAYNGNPIDIVKRIAANWPAAIHEDPKFRELFLEPSLDFFDPEQYVKGLQESYEACGAAGALNAFDIEERDEELAHALEICEKIQSAIKQFTENQTA